MSDKTETLTPETVPDQVETPQTSPNAAASSEAGSLFTQHYAQPLTPEVSPSGDQMAYLVEAANGAVELWLSPVDGGQPQKLDLPFTPVIERDPDSGRLLRGPQWSPDGAVLALTGSVEGEERTAIWLVPVPSDLVAAETPQAVEDTAAVASTDGEPATDVVDTEASDATDVAGDGAQATEGAGTPPVFVNLGEGALSLAGPRMLTWGPGWERSPRWTPDGKLMAFVSVRDHRESIALATTEGDEPVIAELLTSGTRDDREPVWSRDGKFLAWLRTRQDGPGHADICVFRTETGDLTNLTEAKTSAVRHSLDWVAGRNLIAYVTQETDWLSISVINADNKAGWAVTRESGDKTEPRFHPTEARLVYVRTEGFATVCCERGLHASGAVALDPGEGVVTAPRWLKDKRVVYGFSAPQKPFGFFAQENLASSERVAIPAPGEVSTAGANLRNPVPFEFAIGEDEQFSGMLYRGEDAGPETPGVVYLPDGPLTTRRGEYQAEEQALASGGATVFTPVIHGATGFGLAVEQDLADLAGTEIEVSDIAEAGYALGEREDVNAERLSLVGTGFGGTLALLTAGARPGVYQAVVAVDPITDWSIELGEAERAWRLWVNQQYGMPLTHTDTFALRTPATFAAVIDVPVILVHTQGAAVHREAQLALLESYLDESGVRYERIDAGDEPLSGVLARIGERLAAGTVTLEEAAPADAMEEAAPAVTEQEEVFTVDDEVDSVDEIVATAEDDVEVVQDERDDRPEGTNSDSV